MRKPLVAFLVCLFLGLLIGSQVNAQGTLSAQVLRLLARTNTWTAAQTISTYPLRLTPAAFSTFPACAAGTEGDLAVITDSTTATWGATIAGSGANVVLGFCNGTNWTVAGA